MDCRTFEAFAFGRLAGRPVGSAFAASAAQHAAACPRCRALEALTNADHEPSVDGVPVGLVTEVLERTSRRVTRAAERAGRELPELAERDPGPGFSEAVCRRTSGTVGARLRRHASGWRRAVRRVWLRPRFALEGAYLGVLALVAGLAIVGASPTALAGAAATVATATTSSIDALGSRSATLVPVVYRDLRTSVGTALAAVEVRALEVRAATSAWVEGGLRRARRELRHTLSGGLARGRDAAAGAHDARKETRP